VKGNASRFASNVLLIGILATKRYSKEANTHPMLCSIWLCAFLLLYTTVLRVQQHLHDSKIA
jgi:hypothetical protein